MLEILAVGIHLEAALGAKEEMIFIRFEIWFMWIILVLSCYIDLDYSIGPTRYVPSASTNHTNASSIDTKCMQTPAESNKGI